MMKTVWIIWQVYEDRPGARILAVFGDEKRAREDYQLLTTALPSLEWKLEEIPCLI